MRVVALWRYPVKSLQGEPLDACDVTELGIVGDRRWGILDTSTGYVLTARRVPELLMARARYLGPDEVAITLPDGTTARSDADLSHWLGRAVTLRRAELDAPARYEAPDDDLAAADDPAAGDLAQAWHHWQGPQGVFHDSTRTRLSIGSTESIGGWEPRRFRFNVLVGGGGEDALVGRSVQLGTVHLEVAKRIDRCVMVTRPQPGGIERDTSVLKAILRERNGCLGVGAVVTTPGRVAVGDAISAAR